MTNRLRLLAGSVTFAGAALLASATAANATMPKVMIEDLFGRRYCCGADTNGDNRADSYCCFDTGCSISAAGCVRAR